MTDLGRFAPRLLSCLQEEIHTSPLCYHDIAKLAGCSVATVSDLANGITQTSFVSVVAIAEALGFRFTAWRKRGKKWVTINTLISGLDPAVSGKAAQPCRRNGRPRGRRQQRPLEPRG